MNYQALEDRFLKAIRTTQKEEGGIYVEARLAINNELHTYGQYYSDDPSKPTFANDVPEAVSRFKRFYFPLFLKDSEKIKQDYLTQ